MGALVTKTVTQNPCMGNAPYRTVELPGLGMLNSIGIQNPGLQACLNTEIPQLNTHGLPVVLSLSAHSVEQFAAMAQSIADSVAQGAKANAVAVLELNLSCPNVSAGGLHFGTDPVAVTAAVQAVKAHWPGPVWAKLTPNVTSIAAIGQAAVAGGAEGLTAINTVLGLALDVKNRKPILPRISGGYSGPGIRPIALHALWQLRQALPDTPLIGVGGIESLEDVLAFLLAGANLVQIGTVGFKQPSIFADLHQQLSAYCLQEGLSLPDLVAAAHSTH
jgi:dihydroorotate dehydrogenase (NAD+) catalytic subunit